MASKRLLKNYLRSEKMDKLSAHAEVFFVRLMQVADDYGSYYANIKLLRSDLFPTKDYTDVQVAGWLGECLAVNLIMPYEVKGTKYIRIINFDQRLQSKKSLFPEPTTNPGDSREITVSHGESPSEEKRREVEQEGEGNRPILFGDKGKFWICISVKYASDRPIIIYDLRKFFEHTNQLSQLETAGMDKFDQFLAANPGNVFTEKNHVYNAFRKFHENYGTKGRSGNSSIV